MASAYSVPEGWHGGGDGDAGRGPGADGHGAADGDGPAPDGASPADYSGWKYRRPHPRDWLPVDPAGPAYGTRVEDAQERRIAPGNLRAPLKALAPNHRDPWSRPARTVSVIRHGIDWLRSLLLKGRLWSRVWLLPEPWPEPKLNQEITRHVPP